MITVVKADGSTVANPALQFVVQTADGFLTDVAECSFQIFRGATQVYPASIGTKQSIDVSAHRLGKGRYAALWDSSTATAGKHRVKFFYKVASTDAESSFSQDFEVVDEAYPFGPQYATIYGMRAEGFSNTSTHPDSLLQEKIVMASSLVKKYTGRTFEPEYRTLVVSGHGSLNLLLDIPIVAVEDARFVSALTSSVVEQTAYRVFNRHLTQRLQEPDDRNAPKLSIVRDDLLFPSEGLHRTAAAYNAFSAVWPRGSKNIQVKGVFGYTEPDGSFVGRTPLLIQRVTMMLAARSMSTLASPDEDALNSGRVKRLKTKDQEIEYERDPRDRTSTFTGDPEIDSILTAFRRPLKFGAA